MTDPAPFPFPIHNKEANIGAFAKKEPIKVLYAQLHPGQRNVPILWRKGSFRSQIPPSLIRTWKATRSQNPP
ncbi:hypothetical protein QT17_10990 [Thermus sp. 2.9]|nr:hypothetical protein QT17_10990 [Thermus sp. 2.9]